MQLSSGRKRWALKTYIKITKKSSKIRKLKLC